MAAFPGGAQDRVIVMGTSKETIPLRGNGEGTHQQPTELAHLIIACHSRPAWPYRANEKTWSASDAGVPPRTVLVLAACATLRCRTDEVGSKLDVVGSK